MKEFKKYAETEKDDIFLSRGELHQIRRREIICVACKANPSIYRHFSKLTTSLKEDFDCTTIKTFEEVKARSKTRQAVVKAVLQEQQLHWDLSVRDPLFGPEGCQLLTAVAEQQALERGMRTETEAKGFYKNNS